MSIASDLRITREDESDDAQEIVLAHLELFYRAGGVIGWQDWCRMTEQDRALAIEARTRLTTTFQPFDPGNASDPSEEAREASLRRAEGLLS